MEHIFDMPGRQLLTTATQLKKDPPYQATRQRESGRCRRSTVAIRIRPAGGEQRKRGQQVCNSQRDCTRRLARSQRRESFVLQRTPENFLLARKSGQTRQTCDACGLELPL